MRTPQVQMRAGLLGRRPDRRGRLSRLQGCRVCSAPPNRYSRARDGHSLKGADGMANDSLYVKGVIPAVKLTRGPPE